MKFTVCSDMNITQAVANAHSELITEMDMPSWTGNIKCPYCSVTMKKKSIRGISLKLNPSNIGDVVVEFLCDACKCGDYLYLKKKAHSTKEMVAILKNETPIDTNELITEKEMYDSKRSNSIDRVLEDEAEERLLRKIFGEDSLKKELTDGNISKDEYVSEHMKLCQNAARIPINWNLPCNEPEEKLRIDKDGNWGIGQTKQE